MPSNAAPTPSLPSKAVTPEGLGVTNTSRVPPGSAGWDSPQGRAVGQARESLPAEGSGPINRESLPALENSQQPGRARDNGGAWLPINECTRCGEYDDPETTSRWPEDEECNRICPACADALARLA